MEEIVLEGVLSLSKGVSDRIVVYMLLVSGQNVSLIGSRKCYVSSLLLLRRVFEFSFFFSLFIPSRFLFQYINLAIQYLPLYIIRLRVQILQQTNERISILPLIIFIDFILVR